MSLLRAATLGSSSVCCLIIVLFSLAGSSFALVETSSGTGGADCGEVRCGTAGASCVNGRCKCAASDFPLGNPHFACHNDELVEAFVINDPFVYTWEYEVANLPLPCRYEVTRFTTDYKGVDRDGLCDLQVKAFNKKEKGKFYLAGVDGAVRVNASGELREISFRIIGVARNGNYEYIVNRTKNQFDPDGPFQDDGWDLPLLDGEAIIDGWVNQGFNIYYIHVPACSIWIRFRAFDVVLMRNQTQIPGAFVCYSNFHNTEFEDSNNTVALVPAGHPNAISLSDLTPALASNSAKMVYRALSGSVSQSVAPDPNPFCTDTGRELEEATTANRDEALHNCMWILISPKFIRCYDTTDNGVHIMELFTQCVREAKMEESCVRLKDTIKNSGCDAHDPYNVPLQNYLTRNCTYSLWEMTIVTSDLNLAGTDDDVTIVLHGEGGNSRNMTLNSPNGRFDRGSTERITIATALIGTLTTISISAGTKGDIWNLDKIVLENMDEAKTYTFVCECWFNFDSFPYKTFYTIAEVF